ncbi:hypothetical protein HIM_04416 [Hirsutella minnesotensis 3608]|uniref:OTU domain-containing protein n=1 Tax=Hirsutella minnesotensis 3608 TaxID=1043627 RepID=A0A0F8A624_9HYPO|nr:hypothetical protein HIM_04416 [Hirsutella minnesotensis 3608]
MQADGESPEQMQARHRKELKELQARITSKKKNATKKTRKGVNDECAQLERATSERQAAELAAATGGAPEPDEADDNVNKGDNEDVNARSAGGASQPRELDEQLSQAAAQLQVSDGPAAPQQAGKKRNRHKERLARRAAEHEAAASRAELEASTMTDHRARESASMHKAFAAHDLVEKAIEPDGHCLFAAVADQLGQQSIPLLGGGEAPREPAYRTVRRVAAAFMEENADDFAPFLDEELAAYAARVRDSAEGAGADGAGAAVRRRDPRRPGRAHRAHRRGRGPRHGTDLVVGVLPARLRARRALQFTEEQDEAVISFTRREEVAAPSPSRPTARLSMPLPCPTFPLPVCLRISSHVYRFIASFIYQHTS